MRSSCLFPCTSCKPLAVCVLGCAAAACIMPLACRLLLHTVALCPFVGLPGVACLLCRAASTGCLGSFVFLRGVEHHCCPGTPASVVALCPGQVCCALPAAAAWPACCMEAASHLALCL